MGYMYVIIGIIAFLVTAAPGLTYLGLIFLVIPGLVMLASPSLFLYMNICAIVKRALEKSMSKYAGWHLTTISFLIAVGLGCIVSLVMNYKGITNLREVTSQDIQLSEPPKISGNVAFLTSNSYVPICGSICQNLLYNGVTNTVLVGHVYDPAKDQSQMEVVAFAIEKQRDCPKAGIVVIGANDPISNAVLTHMSSGECIKRFQAKLSDADYIVNNSDISFSEGYNSYLFGIFPINLDVGKLRGRRIEMLVKKGASHYEKIYQFTKAETELLAYPFMLGPILTAGGGDLRARFGVFSYKKTVNTITYNDTDDFAEQLKIIFGKGLDTPSGGMTNAELFFRAMNGNATDKFLLTRYFDSFLGDFRLQRKKVLTEYDEKLLIQGLREPALKSFGLYDVVNVATPEQKIRIYGAGMDRIFMEDVSRRNETVENLSELICDLHDIDRITPAIGQLKGDQQRMRYILDYYNSRISGGWDSSGRYQECINSWQ